MNLDKLDFYSKISARNYRFKSLERKALCATTPLRIRCFMLVTAAFAQDERKPKLPGCYTGTDMVRQL